MNLEILQSKKEQLLKSRTGALDELCAKAGFRRRMYYPNEDVYWGNWNHGERNGFGVMSYSNEILYEGSWKNDTREMYGRFSEYKDIEKDFDLLYTGDVKNVPHGYGFHHYPDGSYYQGHFANGLRNGEGRCWYDDGSFYDGYWKEDLPHGIGLLVQANGNRYEGEWKNGLKDGRGSYLHWEKKQLQEGKWQKGIAVTSVFSNLTNNCDEKKPMPKLKVNYNSPFMKALKQYLAHQTDSLETE